ncbi:MAG TPA: WD40 repeat domain-containing protein [Campylobacterales bacterium]|nr:WD40 repeat domain-containing protein [Campylobacterales bacterium]
MKKILLLTFVFISALIARDITPEKEIKMQGNVMDMTIKGNLLYVGTNEGTLDVYDMENEKFIEKVQLKKIHDFMDDLMNPKVYSVDIIGAKKLLLAEGEKGARELYINENNTTTKVISGEAKLMMQKAKFIDKTHVFLGLLSNEIVLYDLKTKKSLYLIQLSQSKFSDFALNEDKTEAVIACESGINYLVNVKDGKVIKELKGGNKDNVFKVSFKNGKVSAAGQDRIGAVYNVNSDDIQMFHAPFLIYATGLSSDASLAAYAFGIDNEIAIFNLSNNAKVYNLKGQKSTLNSIIFYDKETLYSGSDDKFIMKWSLK